MKIIIYLYIKQNITNKKKKIKKSEGLQIRRLIHFLQFFAIGMAQY